jgi:hypothetical protein
MGLFLYFNLQQCGRLNEGQSNQGPEMAVLFTMGRRGVKRKKETKKSHVVGVVKVCLGYWRRNISNLPWLLWRVIVGRLCTYIQGTSLDPNLLLIAHVVFQ